MEITGPSESVRERGAWGSGAAKMLAGYSNLIFQSLFLSASLPPS